MRGEKFRRTRSGRLTLSVLAAFTVLFNRGRGTERSAMGRALPDCLVGDRGAPGVHGVSMSEIPNTGENHGQVTLIGCFDH